MTEGSRELALTDENNRRLLTLVRHGHSAGNLAGHLTGLPGDPLTQLGEKQARSLRSTLPPPSTFDRAFSSSAIRALQTAQHAGFTDLTVIDDLLETDGGQWAAKTRADFEDAFPDFFSSFSMMRAYPGGESHKQMAERVMRTLGDIISQSVSRAIIFTHLGPINVILQTLLKIPLEQFPMFALKNCAVLHVETTHKDGEIFARKIYFE
jgi:probable phosphoglycerate mutase